MWAYVVVCADWDMVGGSERQREVDRFETVVLLLAFSPSRRKVALCCAREEVSVSLSS